jgi:hypothetical protein
MRYGMEPRHNPGSFLTGDEPFMRMTRLDAGHDGFDASLVFEPHHEGFIGIPHGGLPMGLCLDAWRSLKGPDYPVQARFKFGGSGIGIGDEGLFSVRHSTQNGGAHVSARLTKRGDKTPYLSAEIGRAAAQEVGWVPSAPANDFRALPYYRNCFVCGHHRSVVGLQRRFRLHEADNAPLVTAVWGADSDDADRAQLFLIGTDELHPAVIISIFDENTAWGGFMSTGCAGLSVRMEFTLLRPVAKHEHLLFVGRPSGIRGNRKSPRFFKAEGVVLGMADRQNPEVIAYGRGEWVILGLYTEQIKKNLLPEDDWSWIFDASNATEADTIRGYVPSGM